MLEDNEWGLHVAKTFPVRIAKAKDEAMFQARYRTLSESGYRQIFLGYGLMLSSDLSSVKDVNIPKLVATV